MEDTPLTIVLAVQGLICSTTVAIGSDSTPHATYHTTSTLIMNTVLNSVKKSITITVPTFSPGLTMTDGQRSSSSTCTDHFLNLEMFPCLNG